MRVLIAEDEQEIAKALKLLLEKAKFTVDIVFRGDDAWDYLQQIPYDVVVLDIMMPGLDGLSVLRQARSAKITTPVLLLTAKAEIEDRVTGLESGADDYLPKPFASKEFIARVRALSRRSTGYAEDVLRLGNTQLDCHRFILSVEGNEQRLNNKEFQMMSLFMRHPRFVFSTEHLMEKIWEQDTAAERDVVWTYISFLRRKLRQLHSTVTIKTVRGAGYCLEEISC